MWPDRDKIKAAGGKRAGGEAGPLCAPAAMPEA